MSDTRLLLHILKKVRDTKQKRKYGICGEVIHRLKKYYMVGRGFSDKGPNSSERCDAVVRVQTVLHKLMVQWPGGRYGEDDRYPVEGNGYKFVEAKSKGTLWDNPLRHELLDWLIEELENDAEKGKSNSQHGSSSGEREPRVRAMTLCPDITACSKSVTVNGFTITLTIEKEEEEL